MLIALDASTVKTGFAFGGPDDGAPKGGVWRGLGADEMVFDRTLAGYSESLSLLIRATKAKRVLIEAPMMISDRSAHTAMALIQLTGALRASAHRAGTIVSLVAVQTVRKHFVGNGRPEYPKRAVQDRCKQLGWGVEDDNAADAAALWSYGMSLYYPSWAPRATPLFAERRTA